MSESIDGKSLAQLASFKGGIDRDGPDARTRLSIARSTRKSSFDGFLNTFLGRRTDASGKAKKPAAGPGASAASGMKREDRESLRKSMDKTVAGDGASAGEGGAEADEDVAAAAEEAAVLIWNLLYGLGEGAAVANSVPDSLRRLATMLNSRPGGGGQGGLGLEAVQGAIETANASAEMNSAALLASVDELLEGMPRHVLDEALSRMSGRLGLPASGFEGVLAMLKGQVVGVNTAAGAGSNLLGLLSASANPALNVAEAAAADSALAAESAADGDAPAALRDLLRQFMEEEGGDAKSFAAWLRETGKIDALKSFPPGGNRFIDALIADAARADAKLFGTAEQKNQAFSEVTENLENTLQSTENEGSRRQAEALAQPNAVLGRQPGQTATAQNAQAATVGGMLEQMENIERLSEAMKLATRGGVNNITMQLAPAELGKLMLRVESRNGVVSAKLKVEKKEAAERLGANLHSLRQSLKALGIELGEVEIEHRPPPGAPDLLAELDSFGNLFA